MTVILVPEQSRRLADLIQPMTAGERYQLQLQLVNGTSLNDAPLAHQLLSDQKTIEKAAPAWLAWEHDKAIAAKFAGTVAQAFKDAIAAIRAFLSRLFSGEIRMTPTQAAQEVQAMISVALRAELLPLWRDGWNLGQDSAHQMLDRPRGEGAGEPELQAYIGSRAPNIIARVAETRLDDLPALIAGAQSDDLTPAETALAIAKQLDGESRSELIASTELAAVINAGAMAAYHGAGVDKKDWLVAPDEKVCDKCRANEADGAIPLSQAFSSGVTQGPAHPRCRCCVAPAVTGGFDLTDMHVEPLPGYNPVPLPGLVKVGKEGYIHGWVCVRPPCGKVNDFVKHGEHGIGMIDSVDDDGNMHAIFANGTTGILGTQGDDAEVSAKLDEKNKADAERRAPNGFYVTSPPSLPYIEESAVDGYLTEHGNRLYNDTLRAGEEPTESHHDLDRAISKHTAGNDGTLYRGIAVPDPSVFSPGTEFTDPAYMSTSEDRSFAEEFAKMRAGKTADEQLSAGGAKVFGGKPVIMRVSVRKGDHLMRGDRSVKEVVLPRGQRYRVTSVDEDGTVNVEKAS